MVSLITVAAEPGASAAPGAVAPAASDDIDRARALDQQGVRAYREGRYNDAIRYFEEALKLGGPSSELWNIARCQVKLDEPEAAVEALEQYLARPDLSADDRASARAQLAELARRRSTVTVASSPTGANVALDGRRIGRTPTSTDVAPGEHTIAVQREGYAPYVQRVTSRYGRAIIVDARLGEPSPSGAESASGLAGAGVRRRFFTGSAEVAGLFERLGSLGRPLYPAGLFSLAYVMVDAPKVDLALGARLTVTYASWNNTVGAPALGCGLGGDESRATLGTFGDVAVGFKPTARFRLGGDAGLGFFALPSSALGGDAFAASCNAAPGLVVAGHFGADVSYALAPALRVVLSPILLEVHPAFSGARTAPVDASGAWLHVGAGLGIAVDL